MTEPAAQPAPETPPSQPPDTTTQTPPDTTQTTPPTKPPTTTPPTKPPTTTPPTPATKPAMGKTCGDADACADGLECVKYYGIAGMRGPQFKSCEVTCGSAKKGPCPSGTKCITIADGPGMVCRP